ncbi:MAG: hypothetical protein ACK45A_24125, partial [Planctomyces sp.]
TLEYFTPPFSKTWRKVHKKPAHTRHHPRKPQKTEKTTQATTAPATPNPQQLAYRLHPCQQTETPANVAEMRTAGLTADFHTAEPRNAPKNTDSSARIP